MNVKYNDKALCEIHISSLEKENYYEISISDNGPGIAEVHRLKVFDLFENLKTKEKSSSGIGLATAKKLVTESEGRIWVEAAANNGAKFIFTINKEEKAMAF